MSLITLAQAKAHLQVDWPDGSPPDPRESDLLLKLDLAEAIILDYLKSEGIGSPARVVQAAILLQLGELWRFRGDDAGGTQTAGDLSPTITNVLRRYRDPALA